MSARPLIVVDKAACVAFACDDRTLRQAIARYQRGIGKRIASFSIVDVVGAERTFESQLPKQKIVFTLPEAAEAAGIEYQVAYLWVSLSLVEPTITARAGHGKDMLFARRDALFFCILSALNRQGVGRRALKAASDVLYARKLNRKSKPSREPEGVPA